MGARVLESVQVAIDACQRHLRPADVHDMHLALAYLVGLCDRRQPRWHAHLSPPLPYRVSRSTRNDRVNTYIRRVKGGQPNVSATFTRRDPDRSVAARPLADHVVITRDGRRTYEGERTNEESSRRK